MTKDEKEQLVTIIESEIHKLTAKIEELKQFTGPISPDDAIGRISRMDAINNKTIFDASLRNAKTRLSQLEQILKLKNDGSFGICNKCHQSIPFERLKLRPEIRLCASCLKR
ncbi:TraR/DksA family transcriptional regulator [Marinilabilia salmonicolor]|jgi:DnaK suppressor protein|uniref:TraR/DksA family transcriptional regulator n=1 Tax=Marinilabilia salmonicolor TaxID=989 RepID=UPI000D05DD68|nr:TraR/DksA C4-type zinc finger protein [Marinilabilia salmonicolor]PRY98830.1 TraR/DksA family transcriptional regulator [Marinilabilia salmonicolor]